MSNQAVEHNKAAYIQTSGLLYNDKKGQYNERHESSSGGGQSYESGRQLSMSEFVQFRYWWDRAICSLYRILRCL